MPAGLWPTLLGAAGNEIRAVLFDAVGTFILPSAPIATSYARHGERHGSRLKEAAIAARLPEAFRLADVAEGRSSEPIERDRWRAIVRHVFDDLDAMAALFEELWTYFAQSESWRLALGAFDLLTQCLAGGCRVGVASNFDARLRQVLTGPNQLPSQIELFVSSELGWQKPHQGFFRAIESRLGLSPRQCLLVGDDWKNDIVGARAAGWHTIWVSPSDAPGGDRVPRVAALAGLLD